MIRSRSTEIRELLFVYKSVAILYGYIAEQYTPVTGRRVIERNISYFFTVRRDYMHAIDSVITCVGKLGMSELYAASTRRDG